MMRTLILFKETFLFLQNLEMMRCAVKSDSISGNFTWHKDVKASNRGSSHLLRISYDKEPIVPN